MIKILHHNGNLPQKWKTSLHSSIQNGIIQLKAKQFIERYNGTETTLNLVIYQNILFPNIQDNILQHRKLKSKSNFGLYWRGPQKTNPKKLEETTTQGSNFLVDSSTTCTRHTHTYTEVTPQVKRIGWMNAKITVRNFSQDPWFSNWTLGETNPIAGS